MQRQFEHLHGLELVSEQQLGTFASAIEQQLRLADEQHEGASFGPEEWQQPAASRFAFDSAANLLLQQQRPELANTGWTQNENTASQIVALASNRARRTREMLCIFQILIVKLLIQ